MKNFIFRHTLIILFIFVLFHSVTYSQIINSYGFKGGVVLAKQNYDYTQPFSVDTKYRIGADAGIFGEFFKQKVFSSLAEIHYIQKGYKLSVPVTTAEQPEGTGEYITLNPRVDYVSVPLLAKFRKDYASVSPYLIAGPRFDLKVAYNSDYGYSNYNELNTVDIGLTVGAGLNFHISNSVGLLIEGRYSYPMTSSLSNSFVTVKNNSFEFIGGLEFDISKNKK